ncbi:MAG: phosphoadenylyl-sulfate reductase [Kofleriaceae bacterium]|nr:phosphoadenylyl-sulfate reductase [Kofleriaceae bacterium]MCL4224792.1 phosphoadenylyl-sulfate reductase [Myxococcales bacterium]
MADAAARARSRDVDAPTDDELAGAAALLEGGDPVAALEWAVARFAPHLTLACSFGPEDLVLVELIGRHRLPIEIFTLDTGLFFPETVALWREVEARYGVKVRAVRPAQDLAAQADAHGPELWRRAPDRCCHLRKVVPLEAALAGKRAWITGIRRDQTPDRATARTVERDRRPGLIKLNPLVHWSHDDVWAHLYLHDVPTNPLHQRGYPSIGCAPCTSPVAAGEDPRTGRWRGSVKTECGLHVVADPGIAPGPGGGAA